MKCCLIFIHYVENGSGILAILYLFSFSESCCTIDGCTKGHPSLFGPGPDERGYQSCLNVILHHSLWYIPLWINLLLQLKAAIKSLKQGPLHPTQLAISRSHRIKDNSRIKDSMVTTNIPLEQGNPFSACR